LATPQSKLVANLAAIFQSINPLNLQAGSVDSVNSVLGIGIDHLCEIIRVEITKIEQLIEGRMV